MASSTFALVAMLLLGLLLEAQSVGVCYGRNGNGLPSDREVVDLCRAKNIRRMRIYDPNPTTLNALRGSGIELIVGVLNDRVQSLTDPSAASAWVRTNIVPYLPDVNFRYIAVGNEIHPGEPAAGALLTAMQRVRDALAGVGQQDRIMVTTAIDTTLLDQAHVYPPSAGVFANPGYMNPIVNFLATTGAPILINVYLYYAHAGNPQNIPLDYALFTYNGIRFRDGPYEYQNLFDAILDSQHVALDKAAGIATNAGKPKVTAMVSESGWPSGSGHPKTLNNEIEWPASGDEAANLNNAATYYQNLVAHASRGTPRRKEAIDIYLFSMFDEDFKPPGIEQNYGIFNHDKTPKYQLNF